VVRVEEDEILVGFADRFEALEHASPECGIANATAGGTELRLGSDPLIDFVLSCLIEFEDLAKFFVERILGFEGLGGGRRVLRQGIRRGCRQKGAQAADKKQK
jgi:hypothetical protein